MREQLTDTLPHLVLPLGAGLALGVIGPFGTYELLPLHMRVLYWVTIFSINWLIADALIRRAARVLDHHQVGGGLLSTLAGALLAAPPATGLVALANAIFGIGWPENIPRLAGQVSFLLIVVSIAVSSWRRTLGRGLSGGHDGATQRTVEKVPPLDGKTAMTESGVERFMSRLNDSSGSYPICLQMQDHYLIAYREASSEMILCRMDDAARELESIGCRVHRSWWAAAHAIESIERDGDRVWLRLTNDLHVPVGRSFRQDLKDAGWI